MRTTVFSRINLLKLGAASLLSTALPFGTRTFAAPARTPFSPVRFAVISDLHIDIQGENGFKMSALSTECLQRTVADLNREDNLALVFVLGDLLPSR
ncbi:MAG: hypothetical protein ACL93V_14610 [Candidatus Electrothrix sp. YB6]